MSLALCLLLAIADPIAPFAGDFDAAFEQWNPKTATWSSAQPMPVTGRPIVSGKYVELRGTFKFEHFEKPIELVFFWSWDPFQKRVRVAVLDDFVGLLDVFEQIGTDPLRVSNVPHGTYFAQGDRRGHARFTVHFLEGGVIRIDHENSTDEGKTWAPGSRLTLKPKARSRR